MVDVATPEAIVDALAYLGTLIPGVKAVFGCGSGVTLLGSVLIKPIPSNGRLEPFTWTVNLPDAPTIADMSATDARLDWRLRCRLYFDRSDIAQLQRNAAPFYGRILTAVHGHAQLGGTCNSARVVGFSLGGDEDKSWLECIVSAWQALNFETATGERWIA